MKKRLQRFLALLAEKCDPDLTLVYLPKGEVLVLWRVKNGYSYDKLDTRQPFGGRFKWGTSNSPSLPNMEEVLSEIEEL